MTTLTRYATEDERWQAVSHRDRHADGAFYYVVRTTGVYNRPSCVSRAARRKNVLYFATIEEAKHRGFRPCRRCRPGQPDLTQQHADAVRAACSRIDRATGPLSLDELASAAGFSRFHFHRIFKSVTGVTPHAYLTTRRARRVRRELSISDTVTDAIYSAGFSSNGRFYSETPEILGMTPSSFRSGGSGTSIRFSIAESSLGSALVAVADKGVCAVLLGDDSGGLVRRLTAMFPQARLIGRNPRFAALVAEVLAAAEPPDASRLLPVDIRETVMRMRVRQGLRDRAQEIAA